VPDPTSVPTDDQRGIRMSQEITLTLTVPEANVVLEALGRLPYAEVYELIGKFHQQAQAQLGLAAVTREESA
jgi:hypothetical protein